MSPKNHQSRTSDTRILSIENVISPESVIAKFPSDEAVKSLVRTTRSAISDILHQRSNRLLVVVGPCSVHDPKAAIEYAQKLAKVRAELSEHLEIVMRVYFEKPRTTIGWKGLINDPDLNGSFNVNKGLGLAREVLLTINQLGLPAGTEFLDIVTGQYYADLISWGAIGARTTESQIHRELASGLSCPVGFKNGTDGNLQIAIDAVSAANHEHSFLSPTHEGAMAIHRTEGNKDAHIILRGGKQPNYDADSIAQALAQLQTREIETGLIVDFSHANSEKDFRNQPKVAANIAEQIASGQQAISGVMIESHITEGQQPIKQLHELNYGQSITDACLGFEDTEQVLRELAAAVQKRNN
jgi:3-deoxy-7-phosphoheptulonate synthase